MDILITKGVLDKANVTMNNSASQNTSAREHSYKTQGELMLCLGGKNI